MFKNTMTSFAQINGWTMTTEVSLRIDVVPRFPSTIDGAEMVITSIAITRKTLSFGLSNGLSYPSTGSLLHNETPFVDGVPMQVLRLIFGFPYRIADRQPDRTQ